ncbi:hypothetical protein ABT084_00810 [Streptomyces sp. NPDC002138]|uniref:hypothetical protein n=1 Tax=Streptomyces sp. NPDC002138 TaxID=3154410 RepID=UPI00331D54CD
MPAGIPRSTPLTRTTPPRPVDIEALFPALAGFRRTATRSATHAPEIRDEGPAAV